MQNINPNTKSQLQRARTPIMTCPRLAPAPPVPSMIPVTVAKASSFLICSFLPKSVEITPAINISAPPIKIPSNMFIKKNIHQSPGVIRWTIPNVGSAKNNRMLTKGALIPSLSVTHPIPNPPISAPKS
ncbi:unnamed protein product [Blepharisma stoltei]|uniref:Uncharacterized protein n=1 Tax=Blepharisma stoltei TaxID=1481888 RepID=A0AAU9K2Y4_9CILI|nr:unnamed protein product [Blepharisma stoltei]